VFADSFAGVATVQRSGDAHFRPMDLHQTRDGGMYIIDSVKGRIWKVMWEGVDETG
jgi:glucose/arabinose dehydrogenase